MDQRIPKRRPIERYKGLPLSSLPNEILCNIVGFLRVPPPMGFLVDVEEDAARDGYQDITDLVFQMSSSDGDKKFSNRDPKEVRTLLRLMQTCKAFRVAGLPVWYETVEVWTPRMFGRFFSAANGDGWIRNQVRYLAIAAMETFYHGDDIDRYIPCLRRHLGAKEGTKDLRFEKVETFVAWARGDASAPLLSFIANLPCLRKLVIGGVPHWDAIVNCALPSVTELHLHAIGAFYKWRHSLVSVFPNLKVLMLGYEECDAETIEGLSSLDTLVLCSSHGCGVSRRPIKLPPSLKHLKINTTDERTFWLPGHDIFPWDPKRPFNDSLVSIQFFDLSIRNRHRCLHDCNSRPLARPHYPILCEFLDAAWKALFAMRWCPSVRLVQFPAWTERHRFCHRKNPGDFTNSLWDSLVNIEEAFGLGNVDVVVAPIAADQCCRRYQLATMATLATALRQHLSKGGIELVVPDYLDPALLDPCHCARWPVFDRPGSKASGGDIKSPGLSLYEWFTGLKEKDAGLVYGLGSEDSDRSESEDGSGEDLHGHDGSHGGTQVAASRGTSSQEHFNDEENENYDGEGWQDNEIEYAE